MRVRDLIDVLSNLDPEGQISTFEKLGEFGYWKSDEFIRIMDFGPGAVRRLQYMIIPSSLRPPLTREEGDVVRVSRQT